MTNSATFCRMAAQTWSSSTASLPLCSCVLLSRPSAWEKRCCYTCFTPFIRRRSCCFGSSFAHSSRSSVLLQDVLDLASFVTANIFFPTCFFPVSASPRPSYLLSLHQPAVSLCLSPSSSVITSFV